MRRTFATGRQLGIRRLMVTDWPAGHRDFNPLWLLRPQSIGKIVRFETVAKYDVLGKAF
jgi:hypothetical protein